MFKLIVTRLSLIYVSHGLLIYSLDLLVWCYRRLNDLIVSEVKCALE